MEPVHTVDPIDEIQVIPRRHTEPDIFHNDDQSEQTQEQDDDDDDDEGPSVLSLRDAQKQHRRLGYFDLHPERRPMLKPDDDEDPRSRLTDADSDEDEDDEDIYGPLEDSNAPPSVPPKYSPEKRPEPPLAVIDIPNFDFDDSEWENERLNAESMISVKSPIVSANDGEGSGSSNASTSKPQIQSKTAALIEMYRERERALPAQPVVVIPAASPATIYIPPAIQPSRLPVRALPPPPKETTLPTIPTSSTSAVPPLEIPPVDPSRAVLEESGRGSPIRYVHGAPLHNVLEEEEEEV
jgi:hypothetical protein